MLVEFGVFSICVEVLDKVHKYVSNLGCVWGFICMGFLYPKLFLKFPRELNIIILR